MKAREDYSEILRKQESYQIGFLQGFFDAEGTVHNKRYSIRVASKKNEIIQTVKKLLEKFGIKTGKIHEDKTAFVLPLYGKENITKFSYVIGFRHQEKKDRLSKMIST